MAKNDINVFYAQDEYSAKSEYVESKSQDYKKGDTYKNTDYFLHSTREYVLGTIYLWKLKRK